MLLYWFVINLNRNREKKNQNSKWTTQKNWVFQPPPKADQFSPEFHRLVLGLAGLIDAKDINYSTYMVVKLSDVSSKKG
jgi:hypothetical protein